jgi:hypothetical protein
MLKLCGACKLYKNVSEFRVKNKLTGLLTSSCKSCLSIYQRKHYSENKNYYKEKATAFNKEQRIKLRENIYDYLSDHPCVDCGENDPIVLEFDHISNKIVSVSSMIRDANSWEFILCEISKCEVRCANCHRRKTARQFGWFKDKPTVSI